MRVRKADSNQSSLVKQIRKGVSVQKGKMKLILKQWAKENREDLEYEYRFCTARRWRFDFALPGLKTGIEYEGLMSAKSRHTTIKGFTGDTEKYNAAQVLGWKVLRYTALNYSGVTKDLDKIINK